MEQPIAFFQTEVRNASRVVSQGRFERPTRCLEVVGLDT